MSFHPFVRQAHESSIDPVIDTPEAVCAWEDRLTMSASSSDVCVASHNAFTAATEIAALDFNPLLCGIFEATAQ